MKIFRIIVHRSIVQKKCSLKYGVSCFSIGYVLFASDKKCYLP